MIDHDNDNDAPLAISNLTHFINLTQNSYLNLLQTMCPYNCILVSSHDSPPS